MDAVDGIVMNTEMVIRQSMSGGQPWLLLINKLDDLSIKMKMPPMRFKLQAVGHCGEF